MQSVLNHFKTIAAIPHCSFEAQKLRDYLVEFARSCGAQVSVDEVGNVYAYKGEPKICLQSHYDMVCMGEAPKIELIEEEGYLRARNSSLGADNGIGVAIMMEALREFDHLECLWTSDEEVGLIGANGLAHQIKSKKMLNLDHENDNEVTIGCAGGVDIFARSLSEVEMVEGEIYELETCGFKGGHSGVDIVTNSTNAIKTLALFIAQNEGKIIEFEGGERINSIPKYAKARVIFLKAPQEMEQIKCVFLGRGSVQIPLKSEQFLKMILCFAHGLRSFNPALNIAQTSINLAIARLKDKEIAIDLFARSNDSRELQEICFESKEYFKAFGCEVREENFYLPWEIRESAFSQEVLGVMQHHNPHAKYYAIHAGLECGIIGAKFEGLECCSIGPNIYHPHSTDERCEIESIKKIANVVFEIVGKNQSFQDF
ncbi:M20/M25/M40 family metallo-hydrolase [Helicobacter pametensis]|uniref:M20/M25/M40 family metallo-hydrolase n=1 Tax=Helicobacter pametensis TaxID=95149 RepID=UPI00048192C5|nr:M20/M25/M40 family metallo-hydrolase [Helicobacter pametensis]